MTVGVLQFSGLDKLIHCRVLIDRAGRLGHAEADVWLGAFTQLVAHVLNPLVLRSQVIVFFLCYLLKLSLQAFVLIWDLR